MGFGIPREYELVIIGLNLLGLCFGGEAIVRLVPEGAGVCDAEFLVERDGAGGPEFDPFGAGVPSETAVVFAGVPEVIDGATVVWRGFGIEVQGGGVLVAVGRGVGAPNVAGGGGSSGRGCDLVAGSGIDADESVGPFE